MEVMFMDVCDKYIVLVRYNQLDIVCSCLFNHEVPLQGGWEGLILADECVQETGDMGQKLQNSEGHQQ